MSAATVKGNTRCRSQLPYVNLFDIPEIMPGAQPTASSAQRMEFESRCVKLFQEERHDDKAAASPIPTTAADLQAMFPNMDAALVQTLAAEAPSHQAAMETLLALSAAMADPVKPEQPPKDIGLEDADAFPLLVGADGWEVASRQQLERKLDEDTGSPWCDRAKAAASKPAPPIVATAAAAVAMRRKSSNRACAAGFCETSGPETETDYEYRHRLGKDRTQNRAKFGRQARESSVEFSESVDAAAAVLAAGDAASATSEDVQAADLLRDP